MESTRVAEISDLLRIKESPLPHRNTALDWGKSASGRPSFGSVYVFWWRSAAEQFFDSLQNRSLHFQGPHGVARAWEIKRDSLHVAENGSLPLYVGKTDS